MHLMAAADPEPMGALMPRHVATLVFLAALADSQLLPGPFNIDPKSVSVSGVSAGGYV